MHVCPATSAHLPKPNLCAQISRLAVQVLPGAAAPLLQQSCREEQAEPTPTSTQCAIDEEVYRGCLPAHQRSVLCQSIESISHAAGQCFSPIHSLAMTALKSQCAAVVDVDMHNAGPDIR